MATRCPDCGRRHGKGDIDLTADRATCRGCGRVSSFMALTSTPENRLARRLAERMNEAAPGPVPLADPASPPKGAWFRDDGQTMELGSSTRSIGTAILMVLVGGFWCSITGLFVAFGVTSIAQGLGFTRPNTPKAGSIGAGVFILLFTTPFVAIGVWMIQMAVMAMAGRVAITLRGDDLSVFSGVGPVGRTRRVSASGVESVSEHVTVSRTKNGGTTTTRRIEIKPAGSNAFRFGSALSDARRGFVLGMLKQVLGR